MDEKKIYCGQGLPRAPKLGGIFFQGKDNVGRENDVAIVMGGFARIATREKLLRTICESLEIDSFLFDWHGLGMSEGNFGDVTVERLKDDLKRIVCMCYAQGYQKFHLIGHSLAACVIALFSKKCRNYIAIGKKIFIAPAFNQSYLLRYWFAQKKGVDLPFEEWEERYEKNSSFFDEVTRQRRYCDFSKCWDYEDEFQVFVREKKVIKGIEFLPDYWLQESTMNYLYYTEYDHGFSIIIDKDTIIIVGKHDKTIPIESINFRSSNEYVVDADHDMTGSEQEVAYYVNESIQ